MQDGIRKKFLWQEADLNRKTYNLVNWQTVCTPKNNDGLVVLNIKLLLKWWQKLKNSSYHNLWKTIMKNKYSTLGNQMSFSHLWKEIHKLKSIQDK